MDGGATNLDNLVLVCRAHHRLVHEGRWRLGRDADGKLGFTRPDGRRVRPPPPLPRWFVDAARAAGPAL